MAYQCIQKCYIRLGDKAKPHMVEVGYIHEGELAEEYLDYFVDLDNSDDSAQKLNFLESTREQFMASDLSFSALYEFTEQAYGVKLEKTTKEDIVDQFLKIREENDTPAINPHSM